ncbi:MAG: nodulation protein NfeD [Bdellovibrionales bacterium]|nr:nodulation protein NfeD [Bdellovibrionales bacterium]
MKLFLLTFLFLFSFKAYSECTVQAPIDGAIGPASMDILERSLSKAKNNNCKSLLLLVNTPGGSLASTRKIVEEILAAPIPVMCFVYPKGGHAGSAGAIILQACHVSGATRATNIGAATPIIATGQEMPKDLRNKMINDTTSWLEGLARLRGRDIQFAKDIVTDAKAVSSTEALEIGAIDLLAEDVPSFLDQAKGKEVLIGESEKQAVEIGPVVIFEKDLRHKILSLVANPEWSYLIFMGSLGLLYFEITHPGTIAPGVIGGVGLVISLISMQQMNVEWGGLALIVLGLVFFILEAFVPSFGILGVGGVISFFIGSVFLYDPEKTGGYSLPMDVILPTTILLSLLVFGVAYLAYSTRKIKTLGGDEDWTNEEAVVSKLKNPQEGQVHIKGEIWGFESEVPVELEQKVIVVKRQGLKLKVKPKS